MAFSRFTLHNVLAYCKLIVAMLTVPGTIEEATQRVFALVEGEVQEIVLPAPDAEVLPGVHWGLAEEFLTPAYWALQTRAGACCDDVFGDPRGSSLWDRIAFCLLGGHGITYEVNDAAFERLNQAALFGGATPSLDEVEELLREPLSVNGRPVRYRFPRVKSEALCGAHERFQQSRAPTTARGLRSWLLEFKGIGPKTASWIVRNHFGSDEVAILDVHVVRAGRLMGLFDGRDDVQRHYFGMEEKFLAFAERLGVPASRLDIVMWRQMRNAPETVSAACHQRGIAFNA